MKDKIYEIEREASRQKQRTYVDPVSGYSVFTSYGLSKRADCCGCGCRHCPFGHREVPSERRMELRQSPWIEDAPSASTEFDVVSWSGGKDSFLALRRLQSEGHGSLMLMTTFDGRTEKVAHQEVTLSMIRKQARALKLPLLLIPLYSEFPYLTRIEHGLEVLSQNHSIRQLVFGDLHLEHIRSWREQELQPLMLKYEFALQFPLWNANYLDLLNDLRKSKQECRITAIAHEGCREAIQLGDIFDDTLFRKLPSGVDQFGENGEFHTYVSLSGELATD